MKKIKALNSLLFSLKHFFVQAGVVFKREGFLVFILAVLRFIIYGKKSFLGGVGSKKIGVYEKWINNNENYDLEKVKEEIANFSYKPKISIVTPVYNVKSEWLDLCFQSVLKQYYENWEFCLHDDASTNQETIECLKKWEQKDKRIKISFGEDNQHISRASNDALKLATGEFVALLDNDDELNRNALYELVKLLNKHREADFIYSDEDKLSEKTFFKRKIKRVDPFFKPDWSLDLFLSQMYTCHLGVYRKSIMDEIGGFRKGYEGSQDYDLVLRFIEKIEEEKIFHIPKILYHWRKIPGSTASQSTSKSYAYVSARKAIGEFLEKRGEKAEVLDAKFLGSYRVKREIVSNPKVSIIIPFRDQIKVLKRCVDSILEKTTYENYELILVDNQSEQKEMLDYLESLNGNEKIKVLKYDKPFNFSAINNFAVGYAIGEVLLFLNNDTEVITDEWLSSMVEHIERKDVGIVGAKLLYPNDKIQHAGVILGLGGVAAHAFRGLSAENTNYLGHTHLIRDYSAVTGACLMIKKELFDKVRGFDEVNFAIAYNDVDLCLKVRELGYLVVYTPYAELYHYESLSRGNDDEAKVVNPEKYKRFMREQQNMKTKWGKYIDNDPYYNINLTRDREDLSLSNR